MPVTNAATKELPPRITFVQEMQSGCVIDASEAQMSSTTMLGYKLATV